MAPKRLTTTDPATGRRVTFLWMGAQEPTPEELQEIYAEAGLRVAKPMRPMASHAPSALNPAPKPGPRMTGIDNRERTLGTRIGDFFSKNSGAATVPHEHPDEPGLTPEQQYRANRTYDAYGARSLEEMGSNLIMAGTGDKTGLTGRAARYAAATESRASAVAARLQALEPAQRQSVVDEIAAAFPVRDSYTKPTAHLSAGVLRKRAEKAGLSPEARQVIEDIATNTSGAKVAPAEVQALVKGEAYQPQRVVRGGHRAVDEDAKKIPGAPTGVSTKAHEETRLRNYMQLVDEGKEGADWYEKGGKSILFHANDDPERARQLAASFATTSSGTSVQANAGFGIKGHNQAMAGVPIETGRFPSAMSRGIEDIYSGASDVATGKKRTPFTDALARGGGFMTRETPARPTNDIWQGEAWGYMNDDGSPLRRGFNISEHDWMDRMSDRAAAAAQRQQVGGRADWTEPGGLDRLQASAWAGIRQRNGEKPYDFAKGFEDNYAQGGRETVPGASTGHLPELARPEEGAARQAFHEAVRDESGIYDDQMRDQISAAMGLPVGRSFEGPGMFQGQTAPGIQTRVATGTVQTGAGRELDEGSMKLLRAAENSYALLTGQNAAAGGRLTQGGRSAADLVFPSGRPNDQQMVDIYRRVLALGGNEDSVAQIFTPNGVRLMNLGLDDAAFEALVKDVQKVYGARGGTTRGHVSGSFDTNDWSQPTGQFGQGYYPQIRPYAGRFDKVAPGIADKMQQIDAQLARASGGRFTLSPNIARVRQVIMDEGFAGLEKLAAQYGIPAAMLLAALQAVGGDEQQ
jgi:hypothetical protein